jgi:signal transduction histidine kinase
VADNRNLPGSDRLTCTEIAAFEIADYTWYRKCATPPLRGDWLSWCNLAGVPFERGCLSTLSRVGSLRSIGTRFSVTVGICAVAFSIILLLIGWFTTRTHLKQITALQAELALEFDLAIRESVAESIHPVAIQNSSDDEAIVDIMSTTFVAHQVFDRLRERFPDYVIKFSSMNPRNPKNRADSEDIRLLEYFRDHPNANRWKGTIHIGGQEYLAFVNAVRFQESCLRCHGSPEQSPPWLVDRYGTEGGFHKQVGDVAGMDVIAVPTTKITASLRNIAGKHLLATAICLIVLFAAIFVAFRFIVTRRLKTITGHFRSAAARADSESLREMLAEGEDEIGVLAHSYNSLVGRLRTMHEELESRVEERTKALTRANTALEEEIATRERLEREVHQIGAREQRRIGQELHDGLGQELTGLSYLAASLHQRLRDKNQPEAESAEELATGIPTALGQLKEIVRGLVPLNLDSEDLIPALQQLVNTVEKQTGVRCRLDADPEALPTDSDAAVQLYRIAQEAITNAVKHGRPDKIVVSLKPRNGHTEFMVRDNGVGLRVEAVASGGCGLRVMQYRARVIGGRMDVRSAGDDGTSLVFTIPSSLAQSDNDVTTPSA